jgi:hypothetical protein
MPFSFSKPPNPATSSTAVNRPPDGTSNKWSAQTLRPGRENFQSIQALLATSQPSKPHRSHMVVITALVVLLIVAVSMAGFFYLRSNNASGSNGNVQISSTPSTSNSPIPSITPTTTSIVQPGTVLYTENGSNNWAGWSGSADWKVLNGVLLNDGSHDANTIAPTITAPYQVEGTSDYAVEAKISIQRQNRKLFVPAFGITVRGATNSGSWQGYWALISAAGGDVSQPAAYIQNNNTNFQVSVLAQAPFDPGIGVHTYRVEVKGNDIKLLIDGSLKVETKDNEFLTGGQVGLGSWDEQLTVSSFSITAL